MTATMAFKSHINGKNADVTIHEDRIEWALEAGRLSMLKKQRGSETIPMRMISSVATEKDGLRFTKVRVNASGNIVEFRVGHDQAKQIKALLTDLMVGAR